ncbi:MULTISPECIES: multicopper oxidase domain-containing protein [Methylobacter]
MNTSTFKQLSRQLATPLAVAISSLLVGLPAMVMADPLGVACTNGTSPNPSFNLTTQTGDIQLPDGNTMYMWGYSVQGQSFQHPGPVLCVNQGDTVTITLTNNLPEKVSIMFPGQTDVLANGVPAQPEFTASRATSLTTTAPAQANNIPGVVQYSFVANQPGTYIYESGTNPQKQVRMGLFGTLIVRPTGTGGGSDHLYNRADSRFTTSDNSAGAGNWDEEFLALLSEIDPYQHWAVEANPAANFNFNNYKPRYWLINGRGFPDSIADNAAAFLPNQPYGALARVHPYGAPAHPYPGAIRYLNVGSEDYPFHPHGNNGSVVGRDGRSLETATGDDVSFEKFIVPVGPGQTWDVLFSWHDAEHYSPDNPVDINIPQIANQFFGQFYNFSPYLGVQGQQPPNWSTLNTCGEYYIISHNHALYQITSWGVNMTGPITYMRVDPPLPNSCAQ